MHVHKGAWRQVISAIALVAFALPLTNLQPSPAQAQTPTFPTGFVPSSEPAFGSVSPAVAFNVIGTNHTVTFTCSAASTSAVVTAEGITTTAAGCYDVIGSVQDFSTGSATSIVGGQCRGAEFGPVFVTGSTVSCFGPISPFTCPSVGAASPFTFNPATGLCEATIAAGNFFTTVASCTAVAGAVANAAGTLCTVGPAAGNTMAVKINPGVNHSFGIFFTGYVPATCPSGTLLEGTAGAPGFGTCVTAAGAAAGPAPTCPVSSTGQTVTPVARFVGGPPGFCAFEVLAQKKYVEITQITLTGGPCNVNLVFAEGLKSFFGPGCTVTASAIGTVVLKQAPCTAENLPQLIANGTVTVPPDFPSGSKLICENGLVAVTGVKVTNVPLTFTVTGAASFNTTTSLNGFCTGVSGGTTTVALPGTPVTFCPTGPGGGSVQACLLPAAGSNLTLPNTQPNICSNTIAFTFTQTAARTVPYVRWAGEKIALTKCFGVGLGNQPIEFTLKGNNPGLNATLLPADLAGPINATANPAVPGIASPSTTTIWEVTDANGCATVLGLADGEGVMYVDAAVFNSNGLFGTFGVTAAQCTTAGGTVNAAGTTCTRAPAACPGITAPTGAPTFAGGGCVVGTTTTGAAGCTTGTFVQSTVNATVGTGFCVIPVTCPAGFQAELPAPNPAAPTCMAAISQPSFNPGGPMVNEHAFEVFYMKFDHLDLENINATSTVNFATSLQPFLTTFGAAFPAFGGASVFPSTFTLPSAPGATGEVAGLSGAGFSVPLCQTQYIRSMVHGYFEIPGDPSGRPAANVGIPGVSTGTTGSTSSTGGTASVVSPVNLTNTVGSYVLPAGRWVLPDDWAVLATFAGLGTAGQPADLEPSSVMAWDLNSGWVFNPGGENPVLCTGLGAGNFAPAINTTGPIPTGSFDATGTVFTPSGKVDLGPCYGVATNALTTKSGAYGTAPGLVGAPAPNGPFCVGGLTVGIGPFDATQSCTNPFPLQFTPAGGSMIGGFASGQPCPAAVTSPCIIPAGPNSTYLPNGTLNQWDAPMPPAEITFQITGGPGFLNQVNKTGLYAITLVQPATCATGFTLSTTAAACVASATSTCTTACTGAIANAAPTCAAGYTFNASSVQCELVVNPNPFYAEAIPASPLIPPITNNGGYLWNSWNFTGGTVSQVANVAAITSAPAGGAVAGQSTTAPVTAAICTGIATATGLAGAVGAVANGTCTISGAGLTAAMCPAFGTFAGGAAPTCTFANVPGGLNVTPVACAGDTATVTVANGAGFQQFAGSTVEVFTVVNGQTIATAVPLTGVSGNVLTLAVPAANAALVAALCGRPAFTLVVMQEQFALPVPNGAVFQAGSTLTIVTPNGNSVTVPIVAVVGNVVYVQNIAGIAAALGPCAATFTPAGGGAVAAGSGVSRPTGPAGNTLCEPNLLVPAGSLLETGPKGAACGSLGGVSAGGLIQCAPPNPYPFWQWVPGPASSTCCANHGTVYSDNHGEAVVSLDTGIKSFVTQAPSATGTCPSGFAAVKNANGVVTSCQLVNLALLGSGTTPFANVATLLKQFSATNPGCINTLAAGGTNPAVPLTVINPATGPPAGVVCVNALGGVEFGTGAVLGATTVQATADYPYTRGEHPKIGSAPLTKLFTSGFAKTVVVTPATSVSVGGATVGSYNVTITATDVCGNPLTGEQISVFGLGTTNAFVLAPVTYGTLISQSSTSAVLTTVPSGSTGAGTATLSLEVLGNANCLLIKVVFPLEKIERFATVLPCATPQATLQVPYGPGWNMVGGPAGSNFTTAQAMFSYNAAAGQYANATSSAGSISSAAPSCAGYWAYFAAPMVVGLAASSKSGDTTSCTLGAGWNLVGNLFGTPAKLPTGVTGYFWNGASYDTRTTVPVGGAVWVYNDGTLGSVTLTAT